MSDPGGPQDSPPPGYLIPSDDQRGVQRSGQEEPPQPPRPDPPRPAEPAQPAFTLPSAEPESPVSGPQQPSGYNPGTTQIPLDSGPSGYGAQRGAYEGGSYSQPAAPGYGQPVPSGYPQSGPPAYQQSSPPNYQQNASPNYQQSGPPAYQQSGPPAYQQSSPPAYQQSAPPSYDQTTYPQYPQSAVPTTGYDQAAGYQQMGGYPVGPPVPQYGVTLPQSKPPNSGLAVGSMITGIASSALAVFSCCLAFIGIPALLAGGTGLVLGIMARKQIQQSNGAQGGAGMALTGIITGAVGGALGLVMIILGVVFFGMSASGAFDS